MGSTKRDSILLLTNVEHGQSNVVFATAYELLLRDQYEVHIASYQSVAERVQWLNDEIESVTQRGAKATFHELAGPDMMQNRRDRKIVWPHRPGRPVVQSFVNMAKIVLREDNHNYLKTYDSCVELIKDLKPVVTLVEPIFYPGEDACQVLKVPFIRLSPVTFFELCVNEQPRGAFFWKYPFTGTGYSFPVPWHLIPMNVYIIIGFFMNYIFGSVGRTLDRDRKSHGINHARFDPSLPPVAAICPSLPTIDFHFEIIPPTVHGVGPILLPEKPVSAIDEKLGAWLKRRRTILINLGTHHTNSPESALSMGRALTTLLIEHRDLQILWKLKYDYQNDDPFTSTIRPVIEQDRLRISAWLTPETPSILASTEAVAFVHHGGLNCYYEACYAGVPQIVLPTWYDTYQTATKVEYLGVGVYGNKKDAPDVGEEEFLRALRKVLSDGKTRANAERVGKICREGKSGRERAVDVIEDVVTQLGTS